MDIDFDVMLKDKIKEYETKNKFYFYLYKILQ